MADLRVLHDVVTNQPFYPYTVPDALIDKDGNRIVLDLVEEVKDVNERLGMVTPTWAPGRVSSAGVIQTSPNYLLSEPVNPNGEGVKVIFKTSADKNVYVLWSVWDKNGNFVNKKGYEQESFTLPAGYVYRLELNYLSAGTKIAGFEEICKQAIVVTLVGKDIEDRLDKIHSELDMLKNENDKTFLSLFDIKPKFDWMLGTIHNSNGQPITNHYFWRLRTELECFPVDIIFVQKDTSIRLDVYTYENDGTWKDHIVWAKNFVLPANTPFRLTIIDNNNKETEITDILTSPNYLGYGIYLNDKYQEWLAISNRVNQLEKDVEVLASGVHAVPEYWQAEIDLIASQITSIIVEATKNDNEVATFFTQADPHYPSNSKASTSLMKYLSDRCGVHLLVNLGDLIQDSTSSHLENIKRIQSAVNYMENSTDRFILTHGNHDNGAGIVDSNGTILAERIVYDKEWILYTSSKMLGLNNIVFEKDGKAFYYDDSLQKIRFISIDSFQDTSYTIENGVVKSYSLGRPSNEQIEWIENVALKTVPEGYSVVSFSHLGLFAPYVYNGIEYVTVPYGQIGHSDQLVSIFKNFVGGGGVYIGHFAGHVHHDFVSTKDGITCVHCLNDGTHWRDASYFSGYEFVGDAPLKTLGTVTECAFDVVIVNKTTRHVDLIRVGAGENRQFNY